MSTNDAELTARAVGLGLGIGLVLTAAITYLALYSGLAISAAIPAAMICTGVVRLTFRRPSVLENNVAQAIASSGEALAVGVVFTVPALVLSGMRAELSYWEVTIAAALGGACGVLLTIPLRRALVTESDLPFPESVASAKISSTAASARQALVPAGIAMLAGAVFKAASSVVQLIAGTVEGAVRIAGRPFYAGADLSLALVGVGVIVQLEFAALMFFGGLLSWLVAIPIVAPAGGDPAAVAWQTWSSDVRYLGIGAMMIGGLWSILQARGSIRRGLSSAFAGLRRGGENTPDLPPRLVLAGLAAIAVGWFVFLTTAVDSIGLAAASTVIALLLSLAFVAVAGQIVGQVGNSNNPISAMAICALLLGSVFFLLSRAEAGAGVTTSVLFIATFGCVAAATAGDAAQRLKAGSLLGASPRRLQIVLLGGVVAFAFVVAPIVVLLQKGYGIGSSGPDALAAPQAVVVANLADLVFVPEKLPLAMLGAGAVIGVLLIGLDTLLRPRLRLYVMPIAIGMYLPVSISIPLFVGGLVGFLVRRIAGRRDAASAEASHDRSVLLCAGLITGEALVGVSVAVPRFLGWNGPAEVLTNPWLSLLAFSLVLGLLVRASVRHS